jgi:hypothetical protein
MWHILENNLLDWGVFISEMPPEFLEHLQWSTGNWPVQHFWMKQYITLVWKWVEVHQIVARYGVFRRHRKTTSTAASCVFATYCYWLAGHTDWPACGPYKVPQCLMFNIYSLGVGRENILTENFGCENRVRAIFQWTTGDALMLDGDKWVCIWVGHKCSSKYCQGSW